MASDTLPDSSSPQSSSSRSASPRPPPSGSNEYRQRRQALMAAVASPRAQCCCRPRRWSRATTTVNTASAQSSDFHYLCGFPEPDALLLLLSGREEGEAILSAPTRTRPWKPGPASGSVPRGPSSVTVSIRRLPTASAMSGLAALLDGRHSLYLPLGDDSAMALAEELRQQLLARARQGARAPQALVDVAPLIHEQRLIKSDAELALMRHAAQISARAHVRAMRSARPGLTEYQLQAELEHEFLWHGASARRPTAPSSAVAPMPACCITSRMPRRLPTAIWY